MERRDVLKGMAVSAGAVGAAGAVSGMTGCTLPSSPITYPINPAGPDAPNIVVIMVDQMRFPKHFPAGITNAEEFVAAYMPNVHSLWTRGVPFGGHHTAAQACTPARNTMVTGMHARRTYMLNTRIIEQDLTLQPEFPTFGKLLRLSGYRTPWIGKWHLSAVPGTTTLDQYGFDTFTAPDPVGRPDGQVQDPLIADQAVGFLSAQTAASDKFCATVSFVNPHDKQFFWALLDVPLLESKGGATCLFNRLGVQGNTAFKSNYTDGAIPTYGYPTVPDNWESAAQLQANKPYTQWVTRETFDTLFGTSITDNPVETDFTTNDSPLFANDKVSAPYSWWARGLDMYTKAMVDVDEQIGRVLSSIPAEIADNTVIIFTADHGEYGGSHGLNGKAGSFYDEAVRIPLVIVDPRPGRMANVGVLRSQLTSSLDFLPMVLNIAQGGTSWRTGILQELYGDAIDLTAIAQNAGAPGRPYIVSTSDEFFRVAPAEFFMVGLRTQEAKLVTYWGSLATNGSPTVEFYDYSTPGGASELDNTPSHPMAATMLDQLVHQIVPNDLQKPVPTAFANAQTNAVNTYNFNRSLWDSISSGIVSLRC
jgi:arylsulfatase A-like enzyme